jgi:hypothetical protein
MKKKIIALLIAVTILASMVAIYYVTADWGWYRLRSYGSFDAAVHIYNPYAEIDFAESILAVANFHTHTASSDGGSDGSQTAQEMIDAYADAGYNVLAITDHNILYRHDTRIEKAGVAQTDMLVIKGIELSRHNHVGSMFTNQSVTGTNMRQNITTHIDDGNAILMLYHPGRYLSYRRIGFYTDLLERFPREHLVGIEVANQGNRYASDRVMWDMVMTRMGYSRPVWGFANDDAHGYNHIARNWNKLFVDSLDEAGVRAAMINGQFFFYSARTFGSGIPTVTNIDVRGGVFTAGGATNALPMVSSIRIEGKSIIVDGEWDTIEWISCGHTKAAPGTTTTSAIHINSADSDRDYNLGGYVRFVLTRNGVQLFSQPFYIK